MRYLALLFICLVIYSVSGHNNCPNGNVNNIHLNTSITTVTAHFVKFDVILSVARCLEVIYQDSANLGNKFKVEYDSDSTHHVQIHRLWALTNYNVKVYGVSKNKRKLIDTFTVTTLDDIPMIKTFQPTVTFGESRNEIVLFPYLVPFGMSRHPYMVAFDNIGKIVFAMDVYPSQLTSAFVFAGAGFDYHLATRKFLVASTLFLITWNADGTIHKYGETCDNHHEGSYNKFKVGNKQPYSIAATVTRWANESFFGFTQDQDGIVTWDLTSTTTTTHGYLHSTYGLPYELRDDMSNIGDMFMGACAKAPNATSFIQDWTHSNSAHFGSKYFIVNVRHAQSPILLFNHELTKLKYILGSDLSDFTFLTDKARWSGAHDVQEIYSSPNKKILKLLMFDNGLNRTNNHGLPYSRGLVIKLNMVHKTIDFESEYLYNYTLGVPCYTATKGSAERLEDGRTVVTFTYCHGEGGYVDGGQYAYVIEYNRHDVMEAVMRLDVVSGPLPLPGGLYRSRVIPSIDGEEIVD